MPHLEHRQFEGTNRPTTQSFEIKRLGDCVLANCATPTNRKRDRRAFTLIEVVLTVAMLALLTGVFSATMFGTIGSQSLDEGTLQFETMLRMARAEAANQGRRLRLTFTPDASASRNSESVVTSTIRFEWEPQPLAQPGEFIPYENGSWTRTLPNAHVIVQQCSLIGESAVQTLTYDSELMTDGGASEDIQAVNFFPDGSSDSARVILVSTDPDDSRTAVIELDGVNGNIASQLLAPSEFEAFVSEKATSEEGYRAN